MRLLKVTDYMTSNPKSYSLAEMLILMKGKNETVDNSKNVVSANED